MAAGFISFPILTRIFSVSDYGQLSLILTTLFILIAIAKFGIPNSIVRFHGEHKAAGTLDELASTMVIGIVGISAIVAVAVVALGAVVRPASLDLGLIVIVTLLLVTGSISDVLTSFFRAEQRTKLYNLLTVIKRYGSLGLGVFFTFYLVKGLQGFFVGQLLVSVAIMAALFYLTFKNYKVTAGNFSVPLLKASVCYGVPLVWAEFGHLVLNYVDRYLIQFFLGPAPLGIYTAGYNLATHIAEAIIYPINYAMTPVYMSILVNEGTEAARQFFTKMFRYFLLVMIPVVFGVTATGKQIITVLASSKYLDAYEVLVYVIIGQAVYACTIILNSGLFISKKTYIVNRVMLFTCVINVILNLVLIRTNGIVGAAQATLISYILYAIIITYYAFREFSFKVEMKPVISYFMASFFMFFVVVNIRLENAAMNLLAQIVTGIALYAGIALILEEEVRNYFKKIIFHSKMTP